MSDWTSDFIGFSDLSNTISDWSEGSTEIFDGFSCLLGFSYSAFGSDFGWEMSESSYIRAYLVYIKIIIFNSCRVWLKHINYDKTL
jgi:hypothetical protein